MDVPKENRFLRAIKRVGVFLLAAAILVVMYKVLKPETIATPQQIQGASTISKIDAFLNGNTFVSTTYRPDTPQSALPPTTQAPVFGRIATQEAVVFITIDDGVYDDPEAFFALYKRGATATLFLNDNAVKSHYDFFRYWQGAGSTIQNHTISHPHLGGLTHEEQKHEICGNSDLLKTAYGTQSTLFRAPYGETNESTAKAATECSMKAVIWWSVVVDNGKLTYQDGSYLRPGDILLLHFTPHLHSDLQAVFDQIDAQHMRIGQLEDWLH